jgi:hypothetical protein
MIEFIVIPNWVCNSEITPLEIRKIVTLSVQIKTLWHFRSVIKSNVDVHNSEIKYDALLQR